MLPVAHGEYSHSLGTFECKVDFFVRNVQDKAPALSPLCTLTQAVIVLLLVLFLSNTHSDIYCIIMDYFKKKPTPKEAAMAAKRETRKQVRSSQRDMEREIRELDRQEKQITMELRQRAKAAGVNPAKDTALKALAKQLVNVRQQREKLYAAKAHVGALHVLCCDTVFECILFLCIFFSDKPLFQYTQAQ